MLSDKPARVARPDSIIQNTTKLADSPSRLGISAPVSQLVHNKLAIIAINIDNINVSKELNLF
jgi:hypothetical protein